VIGMTTAMVSRKPLVSHCAVPMVTSRSATSTGSATLMIVSLRIMTKADATSSPMASGAFVGTAGTAAPFVSSGRSSAWPDIGNSSCHCRVPRHPSARRDGESPSTVPRGPTGGHRVRRGEKGS
jgi:hypothetical protein